MADETVEQMEVAMANGAEAADGAPDNEATAKVEKNESKHDVTPSTQMAEDLKKDATILKLDDDDEFHKEKNFCNRDVHLRLMRFIFMAGFPLFLLTILTATKEDSVGLSLLIGIGVQISYVVYFSIISYLFWSGARVEKGRYLFRVWTKSTKVPGWATFGVATQQQLFEFEAIQSISEFSAVDGGVPASMLANLGPFTWAVVVMHFAAELHYNWCYFKWDVADFAEILGICGLMMIGFFELDPYNPGMKFFHYVGAGCGVGTIVGFVLQQWTLANQNEEWARLVAPILISVIALVCFILWQYYNKETVKMQDRLKEKWNKQNRPTGDEKIEIMKEISKYSLRNVFYEGVFLFAGATCLSLWLMQYDASCDLGCVGLHDDDAVCR